MARLHPQKRKESRLIATSATGNRPLWTHLPIILLAVGLLLGACRGGDNASGTDPTPQPTATSIVATPTPLSIATATPAPSPTSVPPTATAVPPTATAVPPTPTPMPPTATAVPPTPTSVPPTATATPSPVWIGCQIEPLRSVTVGEILTYTALQNPVTSQVDFVFDHGDGTLDPGPVSTAFYAQPGIYTVLLNWGYAGTTGTHVCGDVTVTPFPGTPTPTPTPQPPVSISCTIAPQGPVIVGEILTYTALQNPNTLPVLYVFDHGDGTLDPGGVSKAFYNAPGIYTVTLNWSYDGQSGSVFCGTVTVNPAPGDPTPTPTPTAVPPVAIGCTISPQRPVTVGEILTYTATQSPASTAVQFVFDHGDGTLDPRPVSQAFYAAPGYYNVNLNWAAQGHSGTVFCGTVTVTN